MAALTADRVPVDCKGRHHDIAVAASTTLYAGSLIGDSSGYARALVAGDRYKGIASKGVDNSSGSAGDKSCRVIRDGIFKMAVIGASATTKIGAKVYASDDQVLTLLRGSNSLVGYIVGHVTSTTCFVRLLVDFSAVAPLEQLPVYFGTPAAEITTAGVATYTIAQLLKGLVKRDPSGGARSDVTPTAALIVAGIEGCQVGSTFFLVIKNTANAAEAITVTAGTDVTLTGTMTIAQNYLRMFLVEVTNITASSEAATFTSLGTLEF